MAQPRDPVTGRFMSAAAPTGASDAAIETMKKFSESLKGFTKNVGEKIAPAAKNIGAAGIRGAVGAGRIVNERRKEAGFTQEAMTDRIENPTLKAMAGGGFDFMNMMGRGLKGLVKGKSGETGDALGGGEGGESTEDKLEDRALLEKISDNVEKIAEGTGGTEGAQPEPAKKGGILGMLAGLGGMLAMGPGGGVLGKVFGAIGSVFTKLGAIAKAIPALVTKAMPFIKQGAKFFKQIFKRLFWPVTALIGIFSFVDGFIAGYQEGGLVEGFKQGIESLFNNLVDAPLNMLKSAVSWIMGILGFENIEKALDSFDFDIGGMLADGFQFLVDFFQDIPDMMKDIVISLAHSIGGERFGGKALKMVGIDVEEHERNKKDKALMRQARDEKTEQRRKFVRDGEKHERVTPGVAPLDDEDAEFMEEMDAFRGEDVAVSGDGPKRRRSTTVSRQRSKLEEQARQIRAAGGKTGVFRKGKLVEVDGKPYTAPELTPLGDNRAGAATHIQGAGIDAAAAGSAPVIIPAPPAPSGGGGGGGTKPVPMPIPLQIATDPTLAMPGQSVGVDNDSW